MALGARQAPRTATILFQFYLLQKRFGSNSSLEEHDI